MATVKSVATTVRVELDVDYFGKVPLDARRMRHIEEKLQAYVNEMLVPNLAILRYSDEQQ